jgi:radical SAM protein with 4Fe4S-binding SPASM domain
MNCQSRWDTYNNPIIGYEEKEIGCNRLWKFMYIWYDGTCNPCDLDYKNFLSVGSVVDKSISEIWHGGKSVELRKSHNNGQRDLHYPCDRCYL